jgi:hypothetical protein
MMPWMKFGSKVKIFVQEATHILVRPEIGSWAGSINTSVPGMPCRFVVI